MEAAVAGATQLLGALAPLRPHWLEDTVAGPDKPGGVSADEVDEFVRWATLCGDTAASGGGGGGGSLAPVICAGGEQHPSAMHALESALRLPRTYQTMLADVLFLGGIAELKRVADLA
eukprot:COSAG01_NODE_11501_length_1920_cov_2.286107_1_plen_118_part_00